MQHDNTPETVEEIASFIEPIFRDRGWYLGEDGVLATVEYLVEILGDEEESESAETGRILVKRNYEDDPDYFEVYLNVGTLNE